MNDSDSRNLPATEEPSRLSQAVRWFRERTSSRSEGSIKELIEEALQQEPGGDDTISAEEKSLLVNMIHFGELTARNVMLPRADIMAVAIDESLVDVKQHVINIGHTRIPVYDESLDKIEGFIHVKDLFPYLATGAKEFSIRSIMRDILFIPPSMRIVDLLMKMRVSGCHIAIVVDEYGGTDGLVTMEDLFEELVGEIQDEHDGHEAEPTIKWSGDHILETDGRTAIEKLEAALGETLGEHPTPEDIDTLGGFIFHKLGRVPVRGEVVILKTGLKAEILNADPRRIRHVRLTRAPVAVPVAAEA